MEGRGNITPQDITIDRICQYFDQLTYRHNQRR